MSLNFQCITVNDLTEFSFIAGTKMTLTFDIYDSGSSVVDLSGGTCNWYLSNYGQTTAILSKSGSITGSPVNRFVVTLDPADTLALSGKYVQQPYVQDFYGNIYRPSQGIITIFPAIV
jgi:hypothetical protein